MGKTDGLIGSSAVVEGAGSQTDSTEAGHAGRGKPDQELNCYIRLIEH